MSPRDICPQRNVDIKPLLESSHREYSLREEQIRGRAGGDGGSKLTEDFSFRVGEMAAVGEDCARGEEVVAGQEGDVALVDWVQGLDEEDLVEAFGGVGLDSSGVLFGDGGEASEELGGAGGDLVKC